MHQELDKTARNTVLDNSLNFVVRAIGEIRDGPAGVDEDLIVEGEDELGKYWQSWSDLSFSC